MLEELLIDVVPITGSQVKYTCLLAFLLYFLCSSRSFLLPLSVSIVAYIRGRIFRGEGTQIEPARAKQGYLDYEDAGGPDAYLNLTAKAIAGFQRDVAARFAYEGGAEL